MAAIAAAAIGGLASIGSGLIASDSAKESAKIARDLADRVGSPEDFIKRSVGLRRSLAFPEILHTREEFDSQFLRRDQRQLGLADMIRREITEDDILPSITRQRDALTTRDIRNFNEILNRQAGDFRSGLMRLSPELAGADTGFRRDLDILNKLRSEARRDLDRGGRLSAEDVRAVEQQTASAVGRRGRGAGAFSVGQLALNRQAARDAREAQRRQFASGVLGLGGQFQNRALQQSQAFTNPFLNLISQSQAANRGLIGGPGQQLAQSRSLALQGTPDIPVFDPAVIQIDALRAGQGMSSAQLAQQANLAASNALAGGFAGASAIAGNLASGLIAQQQPTVQQQQQTLSSLPPVRTYGVDGDMGAGNLLLQ